MITIYALTIMVPICGSNLILKLCFKIHFFTEYMNDFFPEDLTLHVSNIDYQGSVDNFFLIFST